MRMNQTEILELESTIAAIIISLDEFNIRLSR